MRHYSWDWSWLQWMEFKNIREQVETGDVNTDSEINISDITAIISLILGE